MASASTHDTVPRPGTTTSIVSPVRFVGFWTAILVPFVLLSLVLSGEALSHPDLLGGLLAANVAGLVVGKNYGQ